MTTEKEHRLRVGEKLYYSFGDCAGQIYVALCTYFLTGYYKDAVGIAAAGTMIIVARVFDSTSELLMGALIDKPKSKYGNGFCSLPR